MVLLTCRGMEKGVNCRGMAIREKIFVDGIYLTVLGNEEWLGQKGYP